MPWSRLSTSSPAASPSTASNLSSLPKGRNHPYGHGKIEYLSIGFEGALILIAGVYIFYSASVALLHPHPVGRLDTGMVLLGLTALVNLGTGFVLLRAGKRLHSVALVGDGQHLYLDALSTLVSCLPWCWCW